MRRNGAVGVVQSGTDWYVGLKFAAKRDISVSAAQLRIVQCIAILSCFPPACFSFIVRTAVTDSDFSCMSFLHIIITLANKRRRLRFVFRSVLLCASQRHLMNIVGVG